MKGTARWWQRRSVSMVRALRWILPASSWVGVVDPADVPVVGIDPLAPIELPESGPEPPFGVDLAIEALRMKPPVGSPVAGPPRSRPVGSMLDGTPH